MMSNAIRVFFRSACSFSFCRRSFPNSICSAVFRTGRRDPEDESSLPLPVRAPASRALAHSIRCDEYKPSRRNTAAFSPCGAFSYSARIRSLNSGLNARRDGRGAGSDPPGTGWSAEDVDTYTRISDPALGQHPALTRGVSHHPDQEGLGVEVRQPRRASRAGAHCPAVRFYVSVEASVTS